MHTRCFLSSYLKMCIVSVNTVKWLCIKKCFTVINVDFCLKIKLLLLKILVVSSLEYFFFSFPFFLCTFVTTTLINTAIYHYIEKRYHWEQYLCRTQWPLHSHQERIGKARPPDTNGVTWSCCHSDVMSKFSVSSLLSFCLGLFTIVSIGMNLGAVIKEM